ncbi:MAG: putative bifunctional diguanylate cyclase/phosphodiesterase [Caldimicrobium sp.]
MSLYQGMKMGFTKEEIENFLKSFQSEKIKAEIEYRKDNKLPLSEKDFLIVKEEGKLKIQYNLRAKKECLICHQGVKEGNLLGILTIHYFYKEDLNKFKKDLILFLLIFSIFPLLGVYLIGKIQARRIEKIILELRELITKASKFDELIQTEELLESSRTGIYECDELFKNLDTFIESVKKLAVDRKVFEFEIKLLEKFIITSEFIRDWKDYIKNLLVEINKILEIPVIFAIFYVEDEIYDIEVFWFRNPSQELISFLETKIKDLIVNNLYLNQLSFVHHIIYKNVEQPFPKSSDLFSFRVKSIVLTTPKIGGIVGVGLLPKNLTPIEEVAIESILTSLLNVIGSVKAITKYTKELEFYATRDPLTNLYNQRVFWELLNYEVERAKRYNYKFALIFIDLDNFKLINDTYGHHFGDKFLVEVAKILENSKRKGDILARYGGDEFTMILPMCGLTQAASVAERIKENLQNFKMEAPDGKMVSVTASFGIVIFPDHGETSKDLFVLADTLVCKAKREGKNLIVYPTTEEIFNYYREITEISLLVKEAVENKKIIPYFQPIYNLQTGKLFGCEVLMRVLVEEEIIPAQRFINIAETLGLIMEMDFINMEKALGLAKEKNYKEYLFFNLSPKSLIIPEFLERIKELVKKYNYPPEKMVFELTERETVKNLKLLESFIKNLQSYGFKFCIDDFGSGFSSFQYIKHFLIDLVKLEGEFVVGLSQKSLVDLAIVESILALCKRLNIKIIAEYVENKEIAETLKELGVEFGQGYYLGYPAPTLPSS